MFFFTLKRYQVLFYVSLELLFLPLAWPFLNYVYKIFLGLAWLLGHFCFSPRFMSKVEAYKNTLEILVPASQ